MSKNNDRALRRHHRDRVIRNRQDRIPEERLPDPVYLWQLHGPDGVALNVLHRSRTERDETELLVTRKHDYGCKEGPYARWARLPDGAYGYLYDDEPCTCRGVEPTWGSPLRPEPGHIWKFLREYVPDHRPFPEGKLDKTPPGRGLSSKDTGNMKFALGDRSTKIADARKLGFDYPRKHWTFLMDEED